MSRTETGHYRCNTCKADLTLKETTERHLSLTFGTGSGMAHDTGPLLGWRVYKRLPRERVHFCLEQDGSSQCLQTWMAIELFNAYVGDAV